MHADALRVWRFQANAPAHVDPLAFPPPPVPGTDSFRRFSLWNNLWPRDTFKRTA